MRCSRVTIDYITGTVGVKLSNNLWIPTIDIGNLKYESMSGKNQRGTDDCRQVVVCQIMIYSAASYNVTNYNS